MDSRHIVSGVLGLVIGLSLGVGTVMTATVTRSIGGSVDPNVGFGAGRPSYEGPYRDFYKRTVRSLDRRDNVLRNVPAVAEYYRALSAADVVEPLRGAAPAVPSSLACALVLDIVSTIRSDLAFVTPDASTDAVQDALDMALLENCR